MPTTSLGGASRMMYFPYIYSIRSTCGKMASNVSEYLQNKAQLCGEDVDLAQSWMQMDELYAKKLWHQLTVFIKNFIHSPCFSHGGLVEFYQLFLADFEHNIKPLSLVEIALIIVREMSNHEEAVAFIENIKEKVKNDVEAKVLSMVAVGEQKVIVRQMDVVKDIMDEVSQILDDIEGVTMVHARYYDLCSEYYKIKGDHSLYYQDALRYLGCADTQSMSVEEKSQRAFCLAIAALIGEGIYNFGELLSQNVLEGLTATGQEWLVNLLKAFHLGNLRAFYELKPFWAKQNDLLLNERKLEEKIRLLCLMELVFRRHSHQRSIDFTTISQEAQVDTTEVEMLVMRALSLGLLKGTIDEIDKQVNMTWVQPRVLEYTQVKSLRDRVKEWTTQIKDTIHLMEDISPEVAALS